MPVKKKETRGISALGIILAIIGVIIILIAGVVLFNYYLSYSAAKERPPRVVYTRCEDKPLNKPSTQALKDLGIEFTPLDEIANSGQYYDRLIYIPCGYNNSDWDINQFLKEQKTKKTLKPQVNKVIIAAIINCNRLSSKNSLWNNLERYYGRDQASELMPQTWSIPEQIKLFLEYLSETHPTNAANAFILKKNIQGKRGLLLTNDSAVVNKALNDKTQVDRYVVVQEYMTNPYLINGRKLNIRLYIAITLTRRETRKTPKMDWWLYKKGKCIYTNRPFKPLPPKAKLESGDPKTEELMEEHFTSLNLDSDLVYGEEHCPETLEELAAYMNANPVPVDYPELMTRIKLGLKKVAVSYTNIFSLPRGVEQGYQLFGADYIINRETGQPFLLEFNKGPEMKFKSPNDPVMKPQLMRDLFTLGQHDPAINYRRDNWVRIL